MFYIMGSFEKCQRGRLFKKNTKIKFLHIIRNAVKTKSNGLRRSRLPISALIIILGSNCHAGQSILMQIQLTALPKSGPSLTPLPGELLVEVDGFI